jgi:hypothetical protein
LYGGSSGKVEPLVRLHIILRNALAIGVHVTEVVLAQTRFAALLDRIASNPPTVADGARFNSLKEGELDAYLERGPARSSS